MRRDSPPAPVTASPAKGDPRQDPRADPKDHLIRTHGRDPAGDVTFAAFNLGLWAVDAAAFRRFWVPGSAAALPNVQLLLGMDLVRALRHIFWKLSIAQGIFPPKTAAFVSIVNFTATTIKLWLATKAGPALPEGAMRVMLPLAALMFATGSALETGSELQRKRFKEEAAPGTLYTGGLFGYARNINYTGYIMWRAGMALASCHPLAALSPALHAHDFGSRAVPMLERYMTSSYGDQWELYRRKTPYRLFPGLW